ncbi:hypothetical protein [Clostridium hydrogenum]|uniref:hypothetical protein n=1 Tax=Clostridium hydrogenum TaxID=2855764 RepID=UPI001F3F7597|nr:hypothetical protein [Clostridium hydrogenum]
MDFYLNENQLVSDFVGIVENLKEIKEIYDLAKARNYNICIKENMDINYEKFYNKPQILMALGLLKHFDIIKADGFELLKFSQISPCIENDYFIELISLCYKNQNNRVFSLSSEREIINFEYSVNVLENVFKIVNIIGKNEFEKYLQFNPVPQSISEVFEKAENEFRHIKFTDKAYKTANPRNDIYKQIGFSKILNVFSVLEKLIYPFFRGTLNGFTQDSIQGEFKKLTYGIEFSNESVKTMKKYGEQRSVTINGRKFVMSYHIKISSDNRIYFIYDKESDYIYIGHSGKHLQVAG